MAGQRGRPNGRDGLIPHRRHLHTHQALERVTAGTYGQCEDCGDAILTERLRLIPWAECCSRCQRRREGSPDVAPEPTSPVMRF